MSNLPKESAHHFPLNLTSIASMRQNRSVLIERAQYYAILAEREHTIRKGVLIEGGRSNRGSTVHSEIFGHYDQLCFISLIERAHYYAIIAEGERTIRKGILIEGAL